ncbi:exo-alpha-sialidase [Niabella hibiscisoli]|uniref:exo-alpha-sialidase n=1 Tax=Niabella hibiscisoli TaxID=1825928 RepID=UPI001F0D76B3|nr:exo-alpha-sialidase [Niabella hibiscisoli]MCH5720230.1 exo-alpha-sialidase [Niabella hibiscisoli]
MKTLFTYLLSIGALTAFAQQDTARYIGPTLSNVDYHHGQLTPVVGVHNIQVFRANREHPEWAGGMNWTYNHQPMLAYWNNTFYMHFLSNPVGEHIAPGATYLFTSKDGYNWSKPVDLFPVYRLPNGFKKKEDTAVAKDIDAVMHQRMGFYTAKNNKLLALGYYGIALYAKDDPNDGNGVGRVVREINKDGSLGPIYFIRYNHDFNEKNTNYPFYKKSKDKGFVAACDELLAQPLQMQQWVEEADRNDPLIPLQKEVKAFSYYHLPNGRVIGFWKNALTSMSADNGKTWLYNPLRAPGFVNSNAKIWGQKTIDGKYMTVYNPSEFRWPLALSVSDDGLNYKNLFLVNGEITSMRYGGNYKSYGPQYVRGIQEMNGTPPGKNNWVTYSVNKEDMWVAKIPMPVQSQVDGNVDDQFSSLKDGEELNSWNLYSPLWAPVSIVKETGKKVLSLKDLDPFDLAKAERVVPEASQVKIEFSVTPQQTANGRLDIEVQDARNTPCLRLSFDSTGSIITKAGYRDKALATYEAGKTYNFIIELNTATRLYTVSINGSKPNNNIIFAPIHKVHHVSFRTGGVRRFPNADTPTDQMYDLPNAGEKDKEAVYNISYFKYSKL